MLESSYFHALKGFIFETFCDPLDENTTHNPNDVAAQLPSLWYKFTLTLLLEQFWANYSLVKDAKIFLPVSAAVINWINTLEHNFQCK